MVQVVSMPRSGHHLLMRMLQPTGLRYCEFYGCCRTRPCIHGADLQKSHDFDLADPITPGERYIIQIRDPVPSIISHYQLRERDLGNRRSAPNPLKRWRAVQRLRRHVTREGWEAFAIEQAEHRDRFRAKWVLDPPASAIIVDYDDLTTAPQRVLDSVCAFLGVAPYPVRESIAPTRSVESFRYYDPAFFARLSRSGAPATSGRCRWRP